MDLSVRVPSIGDNIDLAGLHLDAQKMLDRAEQGMETYLRISGSDEYKNGNRAIAKLRAEEFKRDAAVIRRLMEVAFA